MSPLRSNYVPERNPRIEMSRTDMILELTTLLGLLFQGIVLIKWWHQLPALVPTHFGANGLPDAWGAKSSLFLLPAIAVGLYIILSAASRYPALYNYPVRITQENYQSQYVLARSLLSFLKTEVIWIFACINYLTLLTALGIRSGLGIIFMPITMLIIFATIAIYFSQAFQNR